MRYAVNIGTGAVITNYEPASAVGRPLSKSGLIQKAKRPATDPLDYVLGGGNQSRAQACISELPMRTAYQAGKRAASHGEHLTLRLIHLARWWNRRIPQAPKPKARIASEAGSGTVVSAICDTRSPS